MADELVKTKLDFKTILESKNLAPKLEKSELVALGAAAVAGYEADLSSRNEWALRHETAIKLALQVKEDKSFPWPNCSNVKFPILTIAALQFLARISIMTKGTHLAKVQTVGPDPDGEKGRQAKRISTHLSMQLTDEDSNWINQDEQAKFTASLVGSGFKKTYYDAVKGVNVSEHVPAMNFVVDYHCKDINSTARATHLLEIDANGMQERVRRGLFVAMGDSDGDRDGSGGPGATAPNLLRQAADTTQGLSDAGTSTTKPYEVLEQYCWIDLDGDDYAEPYIMYVRKDTAQVLRIVARFFNEGDVFRVNDSAIRRLENKHSGLESSDLAGQSKLEKEIQKLESAPDNHIVRIEPNAYFTRYLFVPSPDGGVYGLGLGALLGPMNESVNTLINQLIDGGTMANTAGGFLGRGVKIKAGKMAFDPFEWKPVDSTGDDLRKNIFPLPVREPSAVLFNLLGMLVTYSEKIGGATDIMTGGNPGQNTPAETSRNTVEQGMMLFSGIYSRMFRSFKEELKKFYTLNRLYLESSPRFSELTVGANAIIRADDYHTNGLRISPSASPEAVSQSQIKQKAADLLQLSQTASGFNKYKVMRDFLAANDYDDIDQIYPDPEGPNAIPQGEDPKITLEKAALELKTTIHKDTMQLAIAELQTEATLNEAKITALQAKAAESLANAQGEEEYRQVAVLNAQVGAAKAKQDGLLGAIDSLHKSMDLKLKAKAAEVKLNDTNNSGTSGVGTASSNTGVPAATPTE